MKTNAARLLDTLGIAYALRDYPVDEVHQGAEDIALKVGMPAEQVFKTLVLRGDKHGVCFAVLPANAELDLKALARLSDNRKVEPVSLKELTPLTGYIRGGCTAMAAKKDYPVFVDETIELFDEIAVSAGVRGTQLVLRPADYLRACKGKVGDIARAKAE